MTKDLRIGNVLAPSETHKAAYGEFNTGVVTAIDEHKFTVCNHYPGKWFEPIKLTEDWLIKLGFERYKTENYHSRKWTLVNSEYVSNWFYLSHPHFIAARNGTQLKKIKYVHQLQNLYYSLTGLELHTGA